MTTMPFADGRDEFAALVEPQLPTLTWLAALLAPGEYEDVVQRALSTAWRTRSRFDPDQLTLREWLCGLVADRACKLQGPGVRTGIMAADTRPGDLENALQLLAEVPRLALECRYLVGLSVPETVAVTGNSAAEIEPDLSDATDRLIGELGLRNRREDDERELDARLRARGHRWRALFPAATFDAPFSRVSMLGRRGRLGLSAGIAAAIAAVVVAGGAIVGHPAQSAQLPGTSTATSTGTAAGGTTRSPGISTGDEMTRPSELQPDTQDPIEVGPASAVIGTRAAWPSSGLIVATGSGPGVAGGVQMAWEVATGQLLVGIPQKLLCPEKQVRLQLDSSTTIHVDLIGGIGPDPGCSDSTLRVLAFRPLDGQNDGQSVVRVTGTTGNLVLPGLSAVELDDDVSGSLPAVSSVRTSGDAADVSVRWQPRTGRLLVTARHGAGCGAFATADLGNGTEVTAVIRPDGGTCAEPAGISTHVLQIPPHPATAPLSVVVYNATTDRTSSTDVFEVPATELSPSRASADPVRPLVSLSAAQKKLLGIDRVGRTADNRLYFEIVTGPGTTELRTPSSVLVADQQIVLQRGRPTVSFENDTTQSGTGGAYLAIPVVSDPHQPLALRIGSSTLVLPAR